MTSEVRDPFDIGRPLTREERLERLETIADNHRGHDKRLAVLDEQELLVVAELLDELNALTNPEAAGVDQDGWGRLARQMAVRIYDRLGI